MTNPASSPHVDPIPAHIAAIERPCEALWKYYIINIVLSFIAIPITLPLLYFRYHTMRYRFDAEGIHMKWGIIFRREIMLNYSRIQDIHLQSNFIERMLGLARIQVQTAASGTNAEMTLEGLQDHEAMRDFLYSRMRGAKGLQPAVHHAVHAADTSSKVLAEIAGELRTIRELMEKRPHA